MRQDEPGWSEARAVSLAVLLYAAFTLLLAHPWALSPDSSAMPGDADTDLFVWTLAWNTHALTNAPLSIFDANIYHPHPKTLAFSENLIGALPFAAPVHWLTGRHVLALTIVAITSIILSGVGGYVLGRSLRLGRPAAFLCGMICAFAPGRFFRIGQIFLTSIYWIPFTLAFLHRYFRTRRPWDLRLALACFALQALVSGHGAVFLVVAVLIVLAWRYALGEPLAAARTLRDAGIAGAAFLLPAVLILPPYFFAQRSFNLRRGLRDWATTPETFIASPTLLDRAIFESLLGADYAANATAYAFPGIVAIVLAAIGIVLWRRTEGALRLTPRSGLSLLGGLLTAAAVAATVLALYVSIAGPVTWRAGEMTFLRARDPLRSWIVAVLLVGARVAAARRVPLSFRRRPGHASRTARLAPWRDAIVPPYVIMAVLSFLLAAGPPIGIWPMVYEVPGLNFIRGNSRFMLLGMLALAVLGAIGFDRLRMSAGRRRVLTAALSAVIVVECYTVPLPGHRPYAVEIPAADRWLASVGRPLVVAEAPSNHFDDRLHSTYMLHSMAHWQKTIHGHSGIRTPYHVSLYRAMHHFPSEESLTRLLEAGVTHVVVHREFFEPDELARVERDLPGLTGRLRQVYDDGSSMVYEMVR